MGTASEPAATPPVDGTCPECGFDYDGLDDAEIPEALRGFGRRYRAPLTRGLPDESLDDLVRAHPLPGWSALEYACHVRDVFAVQRERVEQAVAEEVPAFGPMGSVGREEMAVRDRYNDQDPSVVADQLAANAHALAESFEGLAAERWERRFIYNYPEPSERDLRWLARHTVHEGRHHLLDIGRVLRAARGR
jgi:hypothetical protein